MMMMMTTRMEKMANTKKSKMEIEHIEKYTVNRDVCLNNNEHMIFLFTKIHHYFVDVMVKNKTNPILQFYFVEISFTLSMCICARMDYRCHCILDTWVSRSGL